MNQSAEKVKRPRGRPPGSRTCERAREAIKSGQLIALLNEFASGKRECAPHQVTAALGLLRKAVPDLQSVTLAGDANAPLTIITRLE
jgi:hypothetical protein